MLTASETFKADEDGIAMLQSMGFSRKQCIKALQNTANNLERAADWIFSHSDEINSDIDAPPSSGVAANDPVFIDGSPGMRVFKVPCSST